MDDSQARERAAAELVERALQSISAEQLVIVDQILRELLSEGGAA